MRKKKVKKKLTSIDFEYNGELFVIKKGTKISVGTGTADNGEFKYIWTEEATGVGTSHYKRIKHNAEREKSNKEALVASFWYDKFNKNYNVYISFNKWDRHHIMLAEAAENGEIIAIDEFSLSSKKNTKTQGENNTATTNTLSHVLKLKNGSEIKCNILEMIPNESIKVETFDGSIFVFKMDEVETMVKQESNTESIVANNNPKGYKNGNVSGNFETKVKKRRTRIDSIHGFYNATEAYYLVPLQTNAQYDFTTKYGGVGFNHFLAYQFNSYIVLGGVLGFNYNFGQYKSETYYTPYLGLSQKFILLGDKKLSPEISLTEGLGFDMSGNWKDEIFIFDASVGLVYKLNKKLNLRVGAGMHLNTLNKNGYTFTAKYLKIKAGLSF